MLYRKLRCLVLCATFALQVAAIIAPTPLLYAQSTTTLSGTVYDPHGVALSNAAVMLRNEATKAVQKQTSDAQGKYAFANLAAGKYTLQVEDNGFAVSRLTSIEVAAGQTVDLPITMAMANVFDQVTVTADEVNSVAAAVAPMDALLSETTPRTEITASTIQNLMSPVADYGEAVQMVPNTVTLNSNGVGLGQSKTYFRGFPDGDYDIDFDGIPFYDTNTPTHHSWAFFPSQFLGGIDFDRSPGTASTIGPTPFGGSIHLLSKQFPSSSDLRGEFSVGSFHTYLYDGEFDSGPIGPGKKLNVMVDVHHMQSDGFQTFNLQTRNGGDIQVQYKPSDKTTITGFSAVIWLDANTPNLSATRCQMYGQPTDGSYSCYVSGSSGPLQPYTGAGLNFLLVNNADPENYFDHQYNYYHVPTDFEYVGVHHEFTKNWVLDIKPYTYNYDNSEKYSNAVPITDDPTQIGVTYSVLDTKVATLCDQQATKKGVTAEPCGVDKYNSYRKYGETSQLSYTSKLGILRTGMWYEWANTNRHQYPSDPLNNWADQTLPNFAEKFVTNSYQPFVEYQWNALPKLQITPGVKLAYYTIGTQQFADDGKTIGCLVAGCVYTASAQTNINPNAFVANAGSYYATLPSLEANYRIHNNWSVYAQAAQGSIVPPSSVFDFNQTNTGSIAVTLPKQQKNTTYQAGTVLKLNRVTFDADYFHIHFDNSYSCTASASTQEDANTCYLQPSSITQGLEGESNIYLSHGFSAYLNASYDNAVYQGTLAATCTGSTAACAAAGPLVVTAPGGLNVQQTPSDIETEALTYQHKSWDAGFFNKRIGTFYIDNGAYHNQATIDPFDFANLYLNYTIRSGGRFDQTKLRLSFNNIFNSSAITGDSIAGSVTPAPPLSANGTTYTDPFTTNGQTPINGADNISVMPSRSVSFSIIFGFNPKH
jgi:iron complex outermembrane receptor protein